MTTKIEDVLIHYNNNRLKDEQYIVECVLQILNLYNKNVLNPKDMMFIQKYMNIITNDKFIDFYKHYIKETGGSLIDMMILIKVLYVSNNMTFNDISTNNRSNTHVNGTNRLSTDVNNITRLIDPVHHPIVLIDTVHR